MTVKALTLAVQIPALMVACHAAFADTTPSAGPTDTRIRTAIYKSDDVLRLTGQVGFQIDLEFAPDEKFIGMAAGDMEGITFETNANHLFLKPKAPRLSTNLTILTDRHSYHLDYHTGARGADPRLDPIIYAVRFVYSDDEAREKAAALRSQNDTQRMDAAFGASHQPLNLDYAYCGPKNLKPDSASDDGIQTRLAFGSRTELPAIFVRNDDQTESLVNFTVSGDAILIHRIARQFILRRGHLVGCVVNRHFDGAGERLPTGTTAPTVTRDTAASP
jgi:type IV secretion system protein VirB9